LSEQPENGGIKYLLSYGTTLVVITFPVSSIIDSYKIQSLPLVSGLPEPCYILILPSGFTITNHI
jgi:hypothetical protein